MKNNRLDVCLSVSGITRSVSVGCWKGSTQYHAWLGLPDKGRDIKGLVVCNNLDLEPLNLLNGLNLGCYQPSPEVIILLYKLSLRGKPLQDSPNLY